MADWTLLPLEAAVAEPLPLGVVEPLGVTEPLGVAVVLGLAVPGLLVIDWGTAVFTELLELDWVGDGLADGQLALLEAVGLAVAVAEEVPAALELAGADGLGRELDVAAAVGAVLGALLGLVTGLGGRLDCGGRTLVTSLITGSGLSGNAEAPSR